MLLLEPCTAKSPVTVKFVIGDRTTYCYGSANVVGFGLGELIGLAAFTITSPSKLTKPFAVVNVISPVLVVVGFNPALLCIVVGPVLFFLCVNFDPVVGRTVLDPDHLQLLFYHLHIMRPGPIYTSLNILGREPNRMYYLLFWDYRPVNLKWKLNASRHLVHLILPYHWADLPTTISTTCTF